MPLPTAIKRTTDPNLKNLYPFHHACEYEPKQPTQDTALWLVPNLIPHDGTVILAAAPKKGKTLFAAALARAVATGSEFLGHQLVKAPVLWCAYEETPTERMPTLKGIPAEDPFYIGFRPTLPALDDPDFGVVVTSRTGRQPMTQIYHRANEIEARLVVIDCLHAAVQFTDLANNFEARRLMLAIRDWSHTVGCATLVLHHLTKTAHRGYHPERFADSSQLLASASTHFFMETWRDSANGPFRIRLHGSGRHPAPPATLELASDDPNHYEVVQPGVAPENPEDEKGAASENLIREALAEEADQNAKEIAETIQRTPSLVRKALAKLPDVIRRWDREEKAYFYSLLSQKAHLEAHDEEHGILSSFEQSPGPDGTEWRPI